MPMYHNDYGEKVTSLRIARRRVALLEEVLGALMDAPVMGLIDTEEYLKACVVLGRDPEASTIGKKP